MPTVTYRIEPRASAAPTLSRRDCANALWQGVEWLDETTGFAPCPGIASHDPKLPSGRKDFRIALKGAPTGFCFHQQCATLVAAFNAQLRSAIGRAEAGLPAAAYTRPAMPSRPSSVGVAIAASAKAKLPGILRDYAWPLSSMLSDSLISIPESDNGYHLMLSLFAPDDVL